MGKNIDYAMWVLIIILAVLVFGYLSSLGVFEKIRLKTIGKAPTTEAETYADIVAFYSINRSFVLASGINFSVTGTGIDNNNATDNFDGSDQTLYYIGLEPDFIPAVAPLRIDDDVRTVVAHGLDDVTIP